MFFVDKKYTNKDMKISMIRELTTNSKFNQSPNLPYSKGVGSRWWLSQSGGPRREKSPVERFMGAAIVPILFLHECTLVLYKQLIQTGFGCYPSYFPLSWAFLSTCPQPMGEPPHTSQSQSQSQ